MEAFRLRSTSGGAELHCPAVVDVSSLVWPSLHHFQTTQTPRSTLMRDQSVGRNLLRFLASNFWFQVDFPRDIFTFLNAKFPSTLEEFILMPDSSIRPLSVGRTAARVGGSAACLILGLICLPWAPTAAVGPPCDGRLPASPLSSTSASRSSSSGLAWCPPLRTVGSNRVRRSPLRLTASIDKESARSDQPWCVP